MKNFRVLAIAMALVLSLAMTVFAFSRLTTKTVAQTAAASCCSDASCCKDGACKMGGSCCGADDGTCPMKKQSTEKSGLAGVPVEDASQDAKTSQVASDKKNCCAGGGSACCNNGSCCQSKAKTTASL